MSLLRIPFPANTISLPYGAVFTTALTGSGTVTIAPSTDAPAFVSAKITL